MFGPISSRPISALPQGTWLIETEVVGEGDVVALIANPAAEIINDPNNRLVLAISVVATVLP